MRPKSVNVECSRPCHPLTGKVTLIIDYPSTIRVRAKGDYPISQFRQKN